MFNRKQQNSVKQLSCNLKINNFFKETQGNIQGWPEQLSVRSTVQIAKTEEEKRFMCGFGDSQGLQIGHCTTATLSMKVAIAYTVLIIYQTLVDAF